MGYVPKSHELIPMTIKANVGPESIVTNNLSQGCENTMPDLSDLVPFHSRQVRNFHLVRNFYLLVLGQVQMIKES